MFKRTFGAALALTLAASPVSAEVFAIGNGVTGALIVRGNFGGAEAEMVRTDAFRLRRDGWAIVINNDEPGWAAVGCVRKSDGSYWFGPTDGQPTASRASEMAWAVGDNFISKYDPGGRNLGVCGGPWDNSRPGVRYDWSPGEEPGGPSSPGQPLPKPKPAVLPPAAPLKMLPVPPRVQGLAEQRRRLEEALRAAIAAKDYARAQQLLDQLRGNKAEADRAGVGDRVLKLSQTPIGDLPAPILAPRDAKPPPAPADGTRFGEAKLRCFAPHEVVRPLTEADCAPPAPPKPANVLDGVPPQGTNPAFIWKEGVSVCEPTGGKGFGPWRCTGPLQFSYANFDKPGWQSEIRMTCGTKSDVPVTRLGRVGRYEIVGCGVPVRSGGDGDIAAKRGIDGQIGGRKVWVCPNGRQSCQRT